MLFVCTMHRNTITKHISKTTQVWKQNTMNSKITPAQDKGFEKKINMKYFEMTVFIKIIFILKISYLQRKHAVRWPQAKYEEIRLLWAPETIQMSLRITGGAVAN